MTCLKVHEKLTVSLIKEASEALRRAAAAENISRTDTVNRALQMWDHLIGLRKTGHEILIRDARGQVYELEIINRNDPS